MPGDQAIVDLPHTPYTFHEVERLPRNFGIFLVLAGGGCDRRMRTGEGGGDEGNAIGHVCGSMCFCEDVE